MPTDQADAEFAARGEYLVEDAFDFRAGHFGRQKDCRHEPLRVGAHDNDVVCIDVDRVPADQVGRESDRVGLCHEQAVAILHHGGVNSDSRPDDHALVQLYFGEHLCEQLVGQFPDVHFISPPGRSDWPHPEDSLRVILNEVKDLDAADEILRPEHIGTQNDN